MESAIERMQCRKLLHFLLKDCAWLECEHQLGWIESARLEFGVYNDAFHLFLYFKHAKSLYGELRFVVEFVGNAFGKGGSQLLRILGCKSCAGCQGIDEVFIIHNENAFV